MRKTIRFLTLLALLIAAATGARAQNATASHIIKAYTTNKTATMNEVLPYKASIIEVVSAVTGISGNVLTISGTVTNVNSSNTDVVTFGALEGWNTKFKVIAAGEAKISVTISNNANPLEFFISVIPPFNISLTSGTEDADKWKVKVGTANATALPIGGLKKNDAVTLTYNGRRKVKDVTATMEPVAPPLTMEAITAGTITIKNPKAGMKYALNDGEKQVMDGTSDVTIDVAAGDKVRFYGNGTNITTYCTNKKYTGISGKGSSFTCKLYGNIMSLVDEDNFATTTTLTGDSAFYGLFHDNYKLTDVSGLVLPATTLTKSCYQNMFFGCGKLQTAPELPATTLTQDCYKFMFKYCYGLTATPDLKATTLAKSCYDSMFDNCTSLTTAPTELPATTMAEACYARMFQGCEVLTKAPELKGTTLAPYCYESMFEGSALTNAPELKVETLAPFCYSYMFKGTGITTVPSDYLPATTVPEGCYRHMFENCANLTAVPELKATQMSKNCYTYMFCGCSSLETAPELKSTELAELCYKNMFHGCTKLQTAPELPATTLAEDCYSCMFEKSGLTAAPELKATTLAEGCCYRMFADCNSLTTGPVLKATTLVTECYWCMFQGSTKLASVTCLATSGFDEGRCLNDWLFGAGTDESVTTRTLHVKTLGTGDDPWKLFSSGTVDKRWTAVADQ